MAAIRIGTCTWNYPSWEGLVYQSHDKAEYLAEYAQRFNAVEIDRWFWSLFDDPIKVRLPPESDAQGYRGAVPESFRFGVKAPTASPSPICTRKIAPTRASRWLRIGISCRTT